MENSADALTNTRRYIGQNPDALDPNNLLDGLMIEIGDGTVLSPAYHGTREGMDDMV